MRLLTLVFCLSLSVMAAAQSRVFIHDGRQKEACTACDKLFYEKPKEVLFVKKAALNAININGRRFCRFFNSSEKDGASFQLVSYDELRKLYCESCR